MTRATPIERYRNLGIIGSIDAGKTTTTERILCCAGESPIRINAESEEDQERVITITAAATTCFWGEYRINLVDMPGASDVTRNVRRNLRVLDGAVAIFCAVRGVDAQSEAIWRHADECGLPRIAFVNKMDGAEANFWGVVGALRERLGARAVPVQVPIRGNGEFSGVLDLVEGCARIWDGDGPGVRKREIEIPDKWRAEFENARAAMRENLAEVDSEFAARLRSGRANGIAEESEAIRRATVSRKIVPVVCGAAFANRSIESLMDAIVRYLPSPVDAALRQTLAPELDGAVGMPPEDSRPFASLAFKVITDPYVGQLTFLRVYSGRIQAGAYVYNPRSRKKERIGRILEFHANERREVEAVYAGDIAAVVGLKSAVSGDTLCDPGVPLALEEAETAIPVISVSVETSTEVAGEKLGASLAKIAAEDPSFEVRLDSGDGHTIICGASEAQLYVILDRLAREFKVEAKTGKPEVAYRETIGRPGEAEGKFVRHNGGRGQYGHVVLRVEPIDPSRTIIFRNRAGEKTIPEAYVAAVEKGIQEAASRGGLAGYPVVGVSVTLMGGSFHESFSSEMAFRIAAAAAFREAIEKSSPRLLEPVMTVEIAAPEEFRAVVLADVEHRRGQILAFEQRPGGRIIRAAVPLSELLGYAGDLRSATEDRATHFIQFSHYEELPAKECREAARTG